MSQVRPASVCFELEIELVVVFDLVEERLEAQFARPDPELEEPAVAFHHLLLEAGHEIAEQRVFHAEPGFLLAHLVEHRVDLREGEQPDHVIVPAATIDLDPVVEGVLQLIVLERLHVYRLEGQVALHQRILVLLVFAVEVLDPGGEALGAQHLALGLLFRRGRYDGDVDPPVLEPAVVALAARGWPWPRARIAGRGCRSCAGSTTGRTG